MSGNPIIRRYRFSQLRAQQISIFGSVYAAIVLLILFVNISVYRYGDGYESLTDLYKGLFIQFTIMELLLLWLVIPASTSNVVAREINDKSFDFFRMLPLSAAQKAWGILIGRNIFSLIIAAVNLGVCLILSVLVGFKTELIIQMVVLLLAVSAAVCMFGLLMSVMSYKKARVTSIPVLIAVGFFLFGPVMGMLVGIVEKGGLDDVKIGFFSLRMPALYLISLLEAMTCIWAYVGTLRRFTFEYESLFSRMGARLFVIYFIAMIYGLFFEYLYCSTPERYMAAFWCMSLLPVVIVPPCAVFSYDKYLEITRKSRGTDGLWGRLIAGSNVVLGISLYAIWLAAALFVGLSSSVSIERLLWFAAMTLSAYIVILALLELYVTWKPKNDKVGYLVGFVTIVYMSLPLVLAGLLDSNTLHLFSPLGAITILEPSERVMWPLLVLPMMANMVWLGILGVLIGKRYSDLVAMRAGMESPRA